MKKLIIWSEEHLKSINLGKGKKATLKTPKSLKPLLFTELSHQILKTTQTSSSLSVKQRLTSSSDCLGIWDNTCKIPGAEAYRSEVTGPRPRSLGSENRDGHLCWYETKAHGPTQQSVPSVWLDTVRSMTHKSTQEIKGFKYLACFVC